MTHLTEGDPAPDFTLQDDAGNEVSLKDQRGRIVVLYFYPKDDTPGCTKEAKGFRDTLEAFSNRDTVVLGVSPDNVESHQKFKDKHDLNFPLLADPEHDVAEAYGVWGEKQMFGNKFMGIHRTTFVIGPEGEIMRVFENVSPEGHCHEVLDELPA